jgi:exopolysaccharide production protein ExoZ
MVVLFHASENWSMTAYGAVTHAWWNGAGGVDIFFVISGFVMAVSSLDKGTGPRVAWRFLARRIVRIYPLYWIITTVLVLKISLGFVYNPNGLHAVPPLFGLCSYLLIPAVSPGGDIFPVLAPGWTLSYEVFFYLCFAGALFFRRSVPITLTFVLGGLVYLGTFRTGAWPVATVLFNPLLLEFLAGLWLGRAVLSGFAMPARITAALAVIAAIVLFALPAVPPDYRRLEWALCGFLLVQGAVLLEAKLNRIPSWVLLIGDASYSLYLTHAPLIGLYTFVFKWAGVLVPGRIRLADEAITLTVSLLLSILVGIACYLVVEAPMNERFRRLLHLRPVQVHAAVSS